MIYADHNSTTAPFASVSERMLPYLKAEFGNPSSQTHRLGQEAKRALEQARQEIADFLGAEAGELVFTSGGTESNFHALVGAALGLEPGFRIIISSIEHPAVREAAYFLEQVLGAQVLEIAVNRQGAVDIGEFERELKQGPAIVSLMYANNETGALLPLARLSELAKSSGAIVHTDATQAVGKEAITFSELPIDMLSFSAHKFGGPKGVGGLLVRQGTAWQPVVKGGAQEGGRRGGTEAVAQVVGMAEAVSVSRAKLKEGGGERIAKLRDSFEKRILDLLPEVEFTARELPRLKNTSHLRIVHTIGSEIVQDLAAKNILISAGSACKAGSLAPSRVLSRMGFSAAEAASSLRVSFGFENSEDDARLVAAAIAEAAKSRISSIRASLKSLKK